MRPSNAAISLTMFLILGITHKLGERQMTVANLANTRWSFQWCGVITNALVGFKGILNLTAETDVMDPEDWVKIIAP